MASGGSCTIDDRLVGTLGDWDGDLTVRPTNVNNDPFPDSLERGMVYEMDWDAAFVRVPHVRGIRELFFERDTWQARYTRHLRCFSQVQNPSGLDQRSILLVNK